MLNDSMPLMMFSPPKKNIFLALKFRRNQLRMMLSRQTSSRAFESIKRKL